MACVVFCRGNTALRRIRNTCAPNRGRALHPHRRRCPAGRGLDPAAPGMDFFRCAGRRGALAVPGVCGRRLREHFRSRKSRQQSG